jgi:hypothetical protein
MSVFSLESAVRTCKVDTGHSNRIQSDRFLNPRNLVCPVWNGLDQAGRVACPDSFWTKREGCNSAEDRVGVENIQRPQYMQYISDTMSNSYNYNSKVPEGKFQQPPVTENFMILGMDTPQKKYSDLTGSAGQNLNSVVWGRTCGYNRYSDWSDKLFKDYNSRS